MKNESKDTESVLLKVENTNDNFSSVAKLYDEARLAKANNDYKNAEKLYNEILKCCPKDWEARFYSLYFYVQRISIEDTKNFPEHFQLVDWEDMNTLPQAEDDFKGCFETVLKSISVIPDNEEKNKALLDFVTSVGSLALIIRTRASQAYSQSINNCKYGGLRGNAFIDRANIAYGARTSRTMFSTYYCGDLISEVFSEDEIIKTYATMLWKIAIEFDAYKKRRNEYIKKIRQYEPDYTPKNQPSTGGCYIATCVYGSYNCPEVWTLRRYRDNTLAATIRGRLFIKLYYTVSPTIVKWFGKSKLFQKFWRAKLDKMVRRLNSDGVENTPYQDKDWK